MQAAELVRALYERYQARDWDAAAELVHPDVSVAMPETGERLRGRAGVIGFQRDYPEPWGTLSVLRIVAGAADEAAAELEILGDPASWRVAAFWTARDGLLWNGVEYFVRLGADPPPDRRHARD